MNRSMSNGSDVYGNRGERPWFTDDWEGIEHCFADMFREIPFKQQTVLYQETVRTICDQLIPNQ
jgi:hypothetical protein